MCNCLAIKNCDQNKVIGISSFHQVNYSWVITVCFVFWMDMTQKLATKFNLNITNSVNSMISVNIIFLVCTRCNKIKSTVCRVSYGSNSYSIIHILRDYQRKTISYWWTYLRLQDIRPMVSSISFSVLLVAGVAVVEDQDVIPAVVEDFFYLHNCANVTANWEAVIDDLQKAILK